MVLDQWRAEDLRPNNAFSAEVVAVQLQDIGVTANTEVLEVFSHLNGFDEGVMDGHCMNFWSIDKIKMEKRPESDVIGFADFLIDSFRYGFKIESDDSVGIYLDRSLNNHEKVAGSFREFFQLYLTDADKLAAFA